MSTRLIGVVAAMLVLGLSGAAVAGLVAHWKLDETSGTTALDSSGRGFNGTYQGGAALNQPGVYGTAVEFDGVDDRVQVPALNLNSNAVSLTAWVYRRGDPGIYAGIFVSRAGRTTAGLSTGSTLDPDWGVNNLLAYNWNDVQAAWSFNSGLLIPEQEWAFVGVVVEPDKATLYMSDGVLQSAVNTLAHQIEEFDDIGYIGYDPYDELRYWPGMIDDVRVYDRALTADQMQELVDGIEPTWLKAMKPGPANGATAVLLPLLSWTAGDGAAAHNVYLGTTPALGDAHRILSQYTATLYYHGAGLEPGVTYYWRVDEIETDGVTIHPGDVWSFTTQGLTAYLPNPADGATDASPAPTLTWQPGQAAVGHHLYFSDRFDDVSDAAADADRGVLEEETAYAPGQLDSATTYYWRVDEIIGGSDVVRAGPVWSFTTFLPVDNFEKYNDDVEAGTTIFDTWLDGMTNNTGSTVGYWEAPFAEQKIVHGGLQSMPLDYDNVVAPYYSEAERQFEGQQDWTINGLNTLVLHIRGKTTNTPGPLYTGIRDASNRVALVAHPDPHMTATNKWLEWRIPLSEFGDAGADPARVRTMYIGVGDPENPAPNGAGLIYIDDIYVATFAVEMPNEAPGP